MFCQHKRSPLSTLRSQVSRWSRGILVGLRFHFIADDTERLIGVTFRFFPALVSSHSQRCDSVLRGDATRRLSLASPVTFSISRLRPARRQSLLRLGTLRHRLD